MSTSSSLLSSSSLSSFTHTIHSSNVQTLVFQMKRGMEKARATRTAIPQFVRVAPSQHHLHHHHLQHQQPPYHHQYQQQQHRSEQGMPHGTVRTAGVGTDGGGDARNRTYSKQVRVYFSLGSPALFVTVVPHFSTRASLRQGTPAFLSQILHVIRFKTRLQFSSRYVCTLIQSTYALLIKVRLNFLSRFAYMLYWHACTCNWKSN